MSLNINILEIRSEISIVHFYFVSRIHEPLLHFRDHCLIRWANFLYYTQSRPTRVFKCGPNSSWNPNVG